MLFKAQLEVSEASGKTDTKHTFLQLYTKIKFDEKIKIRIKKIILSKSKKNVILI